MTLSEVGIEGSFVWGTGRISAEQALAFATEVTRVAADRDQIARNFVEFPPTMMVRGVFFEGLSRIVGAQKGEAAAAELLAQAGVPSRVTPFKTYPQRDFYKLYYLSAKTLFPVPPFREKLRLVARTFFPIFRGSLLGKTMAALMGERPRTILPLLAKAYNLSVEGNEHQAELTGEREVIWQASVEPVAWYTETFTGIIEGAMPPDCPVSVQLLDETKGRDSIRYRFKLGW